MPGSRKVKRKRPSLEIEKKVLELGHTVVIVHGKVKSGSKQLADFGFVLAI